MSMLFMEAEKCVVFRDNLVTGSLKLEPYSPFVGSKPLHANDTSVIRLTSIPVFHERI